MANIGGIYRLHIDVDHFLSLFSCYDDILSLTALTETVNLPCRQVRRHHHQSSSISWLSRWI